MVASVLETIKTKFQRQYLTNGLYLITQYSFSPVITTKFQSPIIAAGVFSSACNSLHLLWHQRLGHPSPVVFKYLKLPALSHYLPSNVCDVCHLSKQRTYSFSHRQTERLDKFALLHVDIWVPYKQKSLTSASYFVTVVDDYSHFTWTYLTEFKNKATKLLDHHIKNLRNSCG